MVLADDVEIFVDSTIVGAQALRVAGPRPGYWMIRLAKGGAEVPAAIVQCPHEPGEPGNLLDTGPVLVGTIVGRRCDPLDVWLAPGRAITRQEYAMRIIEHAHLRADDPRARPRERVVLSKMPPPW